MATAATIEPTIEESVGALVEITVSNPVAVFTDEQKFSDFYARLKEETDKHVPDLTTDKGRKAIASLAFRVTKAKTSLDGAAKGLTEEWRKQTALVNAARTRMTGELDALAKDVRRPLTEWEEVEKARVAACQAVIDGFKAAAIVLETDTSETVKERGTAVWKTALDAEKFREMVDEATEAKNSAIATLQAAMKRLKQAEADAAELEKLRAAEVERQRIADEEEAVRKAAQAKSDYADQIIEHIRQCGLGMIGGQTYPYIILIRELDEKIPTGEQAEAEFGDKAYEVERIRAETLKHVLEAQERQAERTRHDQAEAAANAAREDAARIAQEKADARQREHDEEIAAANRRAEEAERTAQVERDRIAAETEAREAEEKRIADEKAKREADQAHRTTVKSQAKLALMSCGADEETARKIVVAIIAGEIPAVRIEF